MWLGRVSFFGHEREDAGGMFRNSACVYRCECTCGKVKATIEPRCTIYFTPHSSALCFNLVDQLEVPKWTHLRSLLTSFSKPAHNIMVTEPRKACEEAMKCNTSHLHAQNCCWKYHKWFRNYGNSSKNSASWNSDKRTTNIFHCFSINAIWRN